MDNLKVKIKQTLLEERKRKLEESFVELNDIRDDSYLVERYLTITSKLLEEGYSLEEIESSDISNKLDSVNWKEVMGQGALSAAKEYVIRFVLKEVFGANPTFSTMASQFFADYSPLDLLKPFKDESNCNQYMPKLCGGLLEVLMRYIGSNTLDIDRNDYGISFKGIGSTLGGNLFGELIKESNLTKTMSDKFCKMIH